MSPEEIRPSADSSPRFSSVPRLIRANSADKTPRAQARGEAISESIPASSLRSPGLRLGPRAELPAGSLPLRLLTSRVRPGEALIIFSVGTVHRSDPRNTGGSTQFA